MRRPRRRQLASVTLNVASTIVVVVGILALAVVMLALLTRERRQRRNVRLRVGVFVEREEPADDARPDDATDQRPP